jgi:hypothetical protein
MNRLVAFLFILIHFNEQFELEASQSLAPYSIKAIIDEFAKENNREIEIQNFGVKNGRGSEVITKLLKLENSSIVIQNTKDERKKPRQEPVILKFSSVLVFDSMENFVRSLQSISFERWTLNIPFHLVYIPEADVNFLKNMFTIREFFYSYRCYFLVYETFQSIDLLTPFIFSPKSCENFEWKVINQFTRSQMRWENSILFVDKFENSHKCPMAIQFLENKYEAEIFMIFANHMNFTPHIVESRNVYLNLLLFSLSRGITKAIELKHFSMMKFMHFEQNKIFIPPGELYGDYEKMLLPFDTLTWIGIVLTIFCGVVVIVVIKWLSPNNQEVFFGKNNRSPMMNFISIILNGGQADSLVETLPRMLLVLFIFWCLIFR